MQPALHWRVGGGEAEAQRARILLLATYGTAGTLVARASVMSGRTKNGRGVLFGAARRLLLLRLPLSISDRRANSRDACERARDSNLAAWHTRLFAP